MDRGIQEYKSFSQQADYSRLNQVFLTLDSSARHSSFVSILIESSGFFPIETLLEWNVNDSMLESWRLVYSGRYGPRET
jgi:hypothetical protein